MTEDKPAEAPAPGPVIRQAARERASDFHVARVASAMVLTGLIVVLAVRDAFSIDYALDLQTLVTMLVTVLGLLGLEARDILRKN